MLRIEHFSGCTLAIILLGTIFNLPLFLSAQTNYHSINANITISGTSSLHDWSEKSNSGTATATFSVSNNKVNGLSKLVFTLPAKSLKSDHKGMDNNTYKALDADKHANITYAASSATITPINATTYAVKTVGKLSIAGTTKETDVVGAVKLNPDNSITVTGIKKIKMTDYKVTPPTAMMGTIKTGNDLTISYNVKFTNR